MSAKPSERRRAALGLGELQDRRGVAPLSGLLTHDASMVVRCAAAKALGTLGGRRAVPELAAALASNGREEVRLAAARALGQIGQSGNRSVVAPLLAALLGASAELQRMIVHSLVWVKDTRAVSDLVPLLAPGHHNLLRLETAWALGEIGDAQAVAPLITVLGDTSDGYYGVMRAAAAEALGKLGDTSAITALLQNAHRGAPTKLYYAAAVALHRLGHTAILDLLVAELRLPNSSRWTSEALVAVGDPAVIGRLEAALATGTLPDSMWPE